MSGLFSQQKAPKYVAPTPPPRQPDPVPAAIETPPAAIGTKSADKNKRREGDRVNLFTGGRGLNQVSQQNLLRNKLGLSA